MTRPPDDPDPVLDEEQALTVEHRLEAEHEAALRQQQQPQHDDGTDGP